MKHTSSITNYLDMETKELFNIYSNDKSNKEVRDILIERNLYLVSILAKKYINKGVEFEDLYQVGSLALIYAIERYDISKGYEFSSFATPTIIGEIKKYFRDKVWTMRVPRRVQELNKKVNEAKLLLEQQNKKKPKVNEIAEYIGCREEEVLEALEASYGYQPVSLDSPVNSDSEEAEISLIDKIGSQENNFSDIEYKDFAEWEQKYIKSESVKEVEEYWINKFKDSDIPSVNLPYDYNMPSLRSYKGNTITKKINKKDFYKYLAYAKELGVSPYMFFLSAFFILLYILRHICACKVSFSVFRYFFISSLFSGFSFIIFSFIFLQYG